MDLVARYLQAVQFWLPKSQKQDIIAELSEDLRSQIEEKEAELGRNLTDDEVTALLKRSGSPLVVATRYRPQRYLIGPTLYPVYLWVLGICMLGVTVPRFAIWLGFVILDPAERGVLHMENMFTTMVAFAFMTTLAFVIIEHTELQEKILNSWNPRKLPAVRQRGRIPRASSLFEAGFNLIWILWLINLLPQGRVIGISSVRIYLSTGWYVLLASCILTGAFNLAASIMNLIYTHWTQESATMRLGSDAVGGAIFCWFLQAHIFLGFSAPQLSIEKAQQWTTAINWWTEKMAPFAVLAVAIIVAVDVYRIIRLKRSHAPGSTMGVLAGA
jgi:hypothetical protein